MVSSSVSSRSVSHTVIPLKPRARSTSEPTFANPDAAIVDYRPRSLSVLVLEPSPEAASVVDRTLRRMPWFEAQVTLAGSIEAARFALRTGDVDVVLIAEMADDHAFAFARELAAAVGGPPVILVSQLLATEVEYEAIGFGIAACVEISEMTPRVIETYIRHALWRRASLQPVAIAGAVAEPASCAEQDGRAKPKVEAVSANDNVLMFHRRPVGA
jgi:DNA-binding response OmpR family regulator